MYNRWRPPEEELYHYGVLGMKWGVHKNRSAWKAYGREKAKRDASDSESDWSKHETKSYALMKKAGAASKSVRTNSERKLMKLDARYQKKQAKADRQFDKAERKANSLFTSKRAADRAFRKASKSQFKANKVAASGKKWYEQMSKAYKKMDVEMPESSRKVGEEFIRQVRANSRAMYAASYASGR